MAIIMPGITACSICNTTIAELSQTMSFPAVDGLGKFRKISDSTVHRACLQGWSDRDEFVLTFNKCMVANGVSELALVVQHNGSVLYAEDLDRSP